MLFRLYVCVLSGLKVTSHCAAHLVIFPKFNFRHAAAFTGSSTIIKRLVSSAKRRIFDPMSVTMSFLNSKKSRGPRIEP